VAQAKIYAMKFLVDPEHEEKVFIKPKRTIIQFKLGPIARRRPSLGYKLTAE